MRAPRNRRAQRNALPAPSPLGPSSARAGRPWVCRHTYGLPHGCMPHCAPGPQCHAGPCPDLVHTTAPAPLVARRQPRTASAAGAPFVATLHAAYCARGATEAMSEAARGTQEWHQQHEACIGDMSEGRGARGKAASTCSAARAGSRPIVAHEALVTSAEVSDSMGIGRAGIHTCASARGRERRVSLEFLGARGSRVARNGGRVREDGVRMHAIVLQPAGKRSGVCSRGKVVCIFWVAPKLEWGAHLRGRRFRRTCSRIGAASGGSAARRRSRWMALRPHPPKKTSRSWTRGRASAHG